MLRFDRLRPEDDDDSRALLRILYTFIGYALQDNAKEIRFTPEESAVSVYYALATGWQKRIQVPAYVFEQLQATMLKLTRKEGSSFSLLLEEKHFGCGLLMPITCERSKEDELHLHLGELQVLANRNELERYSKEMEQQWREFDI